MRFSSSFKVGILALVALFILLFTVLWVKGRSFSSGERIEIVFKDVNGMRPGSGVQMMGLRVGQVEDIIPVVTSENSYVKMKFVLTEPGIKIPKASVISIQQSGLIGEQFLEITPPKTRYIYLPMLNSSNILYKNDPVQIKLDNKLHDVGVVKETQVLSSKMIPLSLQEQIKTTYAYKVGYAVNLPGLILPDLMLGKIIVEDGVNKMQIKPLDDTVLPYPNQVSPYTVVEPMRISDFMNLQYKTAESLTRTNQKINDLLSDEVITDLKSTVSNINELTKKATTTVAKAEILIDSSQDDLTNMMVMMNRVTNSFEAVATNVNSIIGDEKFKPTLISTVDSVDKLSKNLNKILDNTDAKTMASDLQAITSNVKEISISINSMTKNDKLKKDLNATLAKVNKAMDDTSRALEVVNKLTPEKKSELEQIIDDTSVVTHNLKKFSEKLNKRFLLFRLMF